MANYLIHCCRVGSPKNFILKAVIESIKRGRQSTPFYRWAAKNEQSLCHVITIRVQLNLHVAPRRASSTEEESVMTRGRDCGDYKFVIYFIYN
jgi:hypothetical protein